MNDLAELLQLVGAKELLLKRAHSQILALQERIAELEAARENTDE